MKQTKSPIKPFIHKSLFACLLFVVACRQREATLFTQVSGSASGITFNNAITENDSINPIDMEFLYNGGGVAIGDFNNDSLPDIYFTASQVSNRMYINKGNFRFADVTGAAKVTGEGRWCNAASVVDINNDGWLDLYVCASISKDPAQRSNLFYINQGLQENGIPLFREMAADFNLADTGFSVHAAFFDYDNDNDLDLYLVNTKLAERNSTRFDGSSDENISMLGDKLYRNDLSGDTGRFTDVSAQANIADEGFGLGVNIADINQDGWKDIYVTNDFFSNDLLYINQKDGTFSEKARACLKHTSRNAMGNDIADFNNDGLADIIAVDMNPEDNYRKKKNLNENNYYSYQRMLHGTMLLQYVRNTLQLNNGLVRDTSGDWVPVFSDIAYYAGVAETDWSWSSLFADFDNDGYKDLFITNGYPKDVTDHDFAFFNANHAQQVSRKELSGKIPQIKIANYAYRNEGNRLKFENVTRLWGLDQKSFSAGAAYADLDNDGDLDYIVNNTNEAAFIYRNNTEQRTSNNFLKIRFKGSGRNGQGIGAIAALYYDNGRQQVAEHSPYRGYLSSMDAGIHFGLGTVKNPDSLVITWPGGKRQVIREPAINTTLTITYNENDLPGAAMKSFGQPLFEDVTAARGIYYRHLESDYIDFDVQRLLPHKLSEYGPCMAAADVDGNGLDDLFVGASLGYESSFLLQQPDGKFVTKLLPPVTGPDVRKPEVTGALLFDADKDGDMDLYTASGSNESAPGSKDYQDRFFSNDGKGNFRHESSALPVLLTSKTAVKAADFDNDGDLDLFIGGRIVTHKYPLAARSYIFRNDTKSGTIRFTDITKEVAPVLDTLGLVSDALWTDYDNDGWMDLVIAGEWMPVTFLKNNKGKMQRAVTTLEEKKGWWNSLSAGDFDNDGDIDYVAGNLGENAYFRGDSSHPVRGYMGDFNKNGKEIFIPSLYLPDQSAGKKEFPAFTRDDVVSQMPALKKKFLTYESFAGATMADLVDDNDRRAAARVEANYFKSVYLENKGNGQFAVKPLPEQAQFAPLNGMIAEDINEDGNLDLILCGNDYGMDVSSGRLNALNGLVLRGDGAGNFVTIPMSRSGFYVPGNAKALVRLRSYKKNELLFAATQNRGFLKLFKKETSQEKPAIVSSNERQVIIKLKNGKQRKHEWYFGDGFGSQSVMVFH